MPNQFVQRTSKLDPTDMWQNPCWYSDANEYWRDTNAGHPWGLPNCTCYVWGRLLELGATSLTLCTGNAGSYWEYNDGYQRGQTPAQGALCCWYCTGSIGYGHVAIVEEVDGTDIIISDSDYVAIADKTVKANVWNNPHYFSRSRMSPPYDFNGSSGYYKFQGFIYVPIQGGVVPTRTWISRNDYLSASEKDENAITFYYKMSSMGVTYNAIIGMLANIDVESTVNPGIWEGLTVGTGGYGLTQWTPYTKYSDWAGAGWENNGDKECERIIYESQNGLQWFENWYAPQVGYPYDPPITLAEFLADDETSYLTLSDYWLLYYEHPNESNILARMEGNIAKCAHYDSVLSSAPPTPPSPSPTPPSRYEKTDVLKLISKRKYIKEKRGLQWR